MEQVKHLMRKRYPTIDSQKTISACLGMLSEDEEPVVVVTSGGSYDGMFDVRKLLVSRLDAAEAKVSKVASNTAKLTAQDSLVRACELFSETPHRALAVLEGEQVVGVLYQRDVQEHFGISEPLVEESVVSSSTLGQVINVLRESNSHAILVKESGEVVGAISVNSLLHNYYKRHFSRDQGMKPRQSTNAFRAEKSSVLELPIEQFIQPVDEVRSLLVQNDALASVVPDKPPRNVAFAGLDSFEKFQRSEVKDLVAGEYDKLVVHSPLRLKVHLKSYHDTGTKSKISVSVKAELGDGTRLEASADEWGLEEAVRSVMQKLEWQVRKHVETN